jgi:hypothetical protein
MATNVKVSTRYATHLPCLIKAMGRTNGDVLELGMGVFSTPYLHYQCMLDKRYLTSYDNIRPWYDFFSTRYGYQDKYHQLVYVANYEDAPIEKEWDVVLIDQSPEESRVETIKRLANRAKYIIIHDSSPKFDRQYHYDTIYPLFKYRTDWTTDTNNATVLSNFVDLKDFWT